MTATPKDTTMITNNYVDDNGETNYEDDDDNSARYDADDCNVRIVL